MWTPVFFFFFLKCKMIKLRFSMYDFLIYNYCNNQNPFWGKLPKYIMQYLDMAWGNKFSYILESLRS